MIRDGLRPGIRLAFDSPASGAAWRRVFPFRKSWVAIAILLAVDAAFIVPAVLTFGQAASAWARLDDLFDLVVAVFLSAWLLGWMVAPLILTTLLAVLLFGREVVKAHKTPEGPVVELFLGLPFIGIAARYDATMMRNMRCDIPEKKSSLSWRGPHISFDYGANKGQFGSDVSEYEMAAIKGEMEIALGRAFRRGDALPEEIQPAGHPRKTGRLGVIARAKEAGATAAAASAATAPLAPPVEPITLSSPSTLVLILANLVPVFGTMAWGWDLSTVMVLYWAESAVIGLFNIVKIVTIGRWASLLAVPFFLGHFGGFMAVHFLFIYTLFVKGPEGMGEGQALGEVVALFAAMWPAFLLLFLSHAYSFYRNFLGRGEFRDKTVKDQMSEPYSRIIFMHLVLIFGGGLSMALGGPGLVIIGVIALKIVFDVRAHLKEHEA